MKRMMNTFDRRTRQLPELRGKFFFVGLSLLAIVRPAVVLWLAATSLAAPATAETLSENVSAATLEGLQEQLQRQQERVLELERLVREQGLLLDMLRQQSGTRQSESPIVDSASGAAPRATQEKERISNEPDALAQSSKEMQEKIDELDKRLGNFSFTGDVRLRYEPFFQGGGFVTRQRERVRARFNLTGKVTDEVSGGISLATGSLEDINSTNQTLTGFFTRKPVGLHRYDLSYKPRAVKILSLMGGKFAYPWYRTPLTFDSDINPEGFAQRLSFDLKNPMLRNVALVGFELPFNEASGTHDSFILGGQMQTRWQLSQKVGLGLHAAGVNFNRVDPIAVAVARGALQPSLPNTNRFRTDGAGQVVGYQSKFLYVDVIAVLDYKLHARWPIQLLFNVVNNTRASSSERTGYWAEVQFGRLSEQKDVQWAYTFARIERDAVLAAFNESDLRASTNVLNHRFNFGYQPFRNLSLIYTLWVGSLANPQDNAALVPPNFRTACLTSPFVGCKDPFLKRMQLDFVYRF
ncbi:MAG: putative porin [Acidobacteria bacterium]|nr:putative porin [Acidobacteriota bacterium]